MTFSDAEYAQDGPTIALKDETGLPLICRIEQTFDIEGRQYALLLPVDTPVEILMWQDDEESEDAESVVNVEEDQIDDLFPLARAVLAEQNLVLQRTAVTLTVSGDIPEPEEDDCFTLEIGEEDDSDEAANEEFQILATFFHEDEEYTVCTPLDPLLLFAQIDANGVAEIVPPEEFERLKPEIESTIFDVLE